MKLAVAVISFLMIMFEVLVIIMVVCCMELTYFVIFRVDDVHFCDILLLNALPVITSKLTT